jgi:hypothetical protein
VGQVDPDQDAALRRLRATFGDVQVLAVVDQELQTAPPEQPALFTVAAVTGRAEQSFSELEPSSRR